MKKKRLPGRPAEKQGTNLDEILSTVTRCFAKNGYGGVSISLLAKEAGIADSLLHYHFGNKEAIWKKAVAHTGNKIIAEMEQLIPLIKHLDGIEQLKILNKKLLYYSASYPEFQQIVIQEVFSKSARSKWLIDNALDSVFTYYDEIIVQEQQNGQLKNIPLPNVYSFIIGALVTLYSRSYLIEERYGINPFDPEQQEIHANAMNDLIFNGLLKVASDDSK
ncbi:MAG: TetR/AcrR family transcriptional regulator [Bacteroidota bacterium]